MSTAGFLMFLKSAILRTRTLLHTRHTARLKTFHESSAESLETPDYLRSPAKRVASQRLYAKPRESSSVYPIAHSSVSPAASCVQPALPSNFSYSGAYERVQQPQVPVYPQQNPQQKGLYSIPSGMSISQPNTKAQSPSQPT